VILDELLIEAALYNVEVYERPMVKSLKGLYSTNIISINKRIRSRIRKGCILAEEIGHHFKTAGNILDQTKLENRQQELRARMWSYERLVPLSSIIIAHRTGIRHRCELAEMLNITESFLSSALDRYHAKYGLYVCVDGYTICLDPLGVIEMFE
jgi:hypothetical protein